jgi:hypothetical protein
LKVFFALAALNAASISIDLMHTWIPKA